MKDAFDRDITYLRISITDLCNLRCLYCMPDGVCRKRHEDILSFEEITEIAAAAASLGVKKLRVTGGEPLVRRGCAELCAMLAAIDGIEELVLTTNGTLLPRYAGALRHAGVRRVNISLDTLDPAKYSRITGGMGRLDDAVAGIRAAQDAGFAPLKINVVLIGSFNDDEIPAFAELTRRQPIELRFIELMPMGGRFGPEAYIPVGTVLERVPALTPLPDDGGVARLYRLPDGQGRVGLISPISRHFCASCNRLRLTSEGHIKPCLHSDRELPLRGLHGDALTEALRAAIAAKPAMHGALDADHMSAAGRGMYTIGG